MKIFSGHSFNHGCFTTTESSFDGSPSVFRKINSFNLWNVLNDFIYWSLLEKNHLLKPKTVVPVVVLVCCFSNEIKLKTQLIYGNGFILSIHLFHSKNIGTKFYLGHSVARINAATMRKTKPKMNTYAKPMFKNVSGPKIVIFSTKSQVKWHHRIDIGIKFPRLKGLSYENNAVLILFCNQ